MKVTWNLFDGIRPRLRPHLLKPEGAQIASNCKLWDGAIQPFKVPLQVTPTTTTTLNTVATTLYRHGQALTTEDYWCTWQRDTDVVRAPNADDTQERLYIADGFNLPVVTSLSKVTAASGERPGTEVFKLGIPAPATPTLVSAPVGSGTPTAVVVASQYVTAWGETGPLSPATTAIDHYAGEILAVDLYSPPGGSPPNNITKHRVYVGVTDANGVGAFRFWLEQDVADLTVSQALDLTNLGEAAPSPSLIAPPDDLFGLVAHPGGFLCGFSVAGRNFCRSEAYKPYGWPAEYRDPLPDAPVGAGVMGSSVVVCTKGKTYLFTGSDPLNMIKTDLEGWQPCASKRSIKKITAGVVYASADGLVLVSGAGPLQVVTADWYTREQWQSFKPESSNAEVHDDRYYWWYDNNGTRGLIIFEFGGGGIQQVVTSDQYAYATFADHRKDELYFLGGSPRLLYKWDAGASAMTATWRSKLFYLVRPQNIGAAVVEAAAYPVTFKLYGNGSLVDTVTVADDRPFTLSGQDRYQDFYMEVSGTQRIDTVAVASSILDLRHGE